jgi:NADH:flavin oxidoreductases, Old Yellow Enzyme family
MKEEVLFTPHALGAVELPTRIIMSPMTRSRATQPGDIPNGMMQRYYEQRADAALIITEASQISAQGQGYSFTPGIYTQEQADEWKKIVSGVHAKGGRIALQLWHVGRMSHPVFHGGELPVAPSAIAPNASVWIFENGKGGMVECPTPRELTVFEIKAIIEDYRMAAKRALDCGFDGVEIHAGNGYLLDEFLRSTSNRRTDEYGGSRTNRMRFILEVVDAVTSVFGADRVGIRLSPHNTSRGMDCPEIISTTLLLAKDLSDRNVAYVHFAEADWDNSPDVPFEFRTAVRKIFTGSIIVAGKYDKKRAEGLLETGLVDFVAFGRPYISNPDLVRRFRENLPLAESDKDTYFGGTDKGYTDYPAHS